MYNRPSIHSYYIVTLQCMLLSCIMLTVCFGDTSYVKAGERDLTLYQYVFININISIGFQCIVILTQIFRPHYMLIKIKTKS